MLTACAQVRAEGWRPKRIPQAFPRRTLMCTHTHTDAHTQRRAHTHTHARAHTFWLCKPERLAAHYHTTGGATHRGLFCVCMCVPAHLRALSSGHNNNCSIICACVCQNESVFNQEDRKTEATENYRICFHRRDNYQIKQIPPPLSS